MDQIRKGITYGSYQIKQSVSYVADHINQNGQFQIFINDEIESSDQIKTISAEIQSRHLKTTLYWVMIRYLISDIE